MKLGVGPIIRTMIISDLYWVAGWGFITPIFAVFIIKEIPGASLVTVGITTAIYWAVKSLLQIPIAIYLDKRGERIKIKFLIVGLFLAGFVALLYILIDSLWGLYFVQALYGISFSFYSASWGSIFSSHLDRGESSFEWALDSSGVGLVSGLSGLLGGVLAGLFGFDILFLLTAIFSFFAAIALLSLRKFIIFTDAHI